MNVEDGEISLARAGVESLENKFLRSGNIQEREILRWRADENQVVIFGVIEREQGAALDPNRPIEEPKHQIELVDRQHLSDPGVMIEDEGARIGCGVEVAHPGLGPSYKVAVAEDDPGLLRAVHETIPKNLIGSGDWLASGLRPGSLGK